jgi:hypothetical protein
MNNGKRKEYERETGVAERRKLRPWTKAAGQDYVDHAAEEQPGQAFQLPIQFASSLNENTNLFNMR